MKFDYFGESCENCGSCGKAFGLNKHYLCETCWEVEDKKLYEENEYEI